MQFDFRPEGKRFSIRPRLLRQGTSVGPIRLDLTRLSPVIVIVSVLLLLILGMGWFLKNIAGASSRQLQTNPKGIVFFTKDPQIPVRKHVSVLWIDPRSRRLTVIKYPDDLMLTSSSFGTYPVSSLYDFFTLEQKREAQLLSALSQGLRVYLSDFVVVSSVPSLPSDSRALAREVLLSSSTTLTLSDRYALFLFLLSSNFVVQTQSAQDLLGLDESKASQVGEAYARWIGREASFITDSSDQLTVAFVNASNRTGSAAQFSTALANFGFQPIGLTDQDEKLEEGALYFATSRIADSLMGQMLEGIALLSGSVNTEVTSRYRADVVLIVGNGLASRFTQ